LYGKSNGTDEDDDAMEDDDNSDILDGDDDGAGTDNDIRDGDDADSTSSGPGNSIVLSTPVRPPQTVDAADSGLVITPQKRSSHAPDFTATAVVVNLDKLRLLQAGMRCRNCHRHTVRLDLAGRIKSSSVTPSFYGTCTDPACVATATKTMIYSLGSASILQLNVLQADGFHVRKYKYRQEDVLIATRGVLGGAWPESLSQLHCWKTTHVARILDHIVYPAITDVLKAGLARACAHVLINYGLSTTFDKLAQPSEAQQRVKLQLKIIIANKLHRIQDAREQDINVELPHVSSMPSQLEHLSAVDTPVQAVIDACGIDHIPVLNLSACPSGVEGMYERFQRDVCHTVKQFATDGFWLTRSKKHVHALSDHGGASVVDFVTQLVVAVNFTTLQPINLAPHLPTSTYMSGLNQRDQGQMEQTDSGSIEVHSVAECIDRLLPLGLKPDFLCKDGDTKTNQALYDRGITPQLCVMHTTRHVYMPVMDLKVSEARGCECVTTLKTGGVTNAKHKWPNRKALALQLQNVVQRILRNMPKLYEGEGAVVWRRFARIHIDHYLEHLQGNHAVTYESPDGTFFEVTCDAERDKPGALSIRCASLITSLQAIVEDKVLRHLDHLITEAGVLHTNDAEHIPMMMAKFVSKDKNCGFMAYSARGSLGVLAANHHKFVRLGDGYHYCVALLDAISARTEMHFGEHERTGVRMTVDASAKRAATALKPLVRLASKLRRLKSRKVKAWREDGTHGHLSGQEARHSFSDASLAPEVASGTKKKAVPVAKTAKPQEPCPRCQGYQLQSKRTRDGKRQWMCPCGIMTAVNEVDSELESDA
jgi:hypothetical protein